MSFAGHLERQQAAVFRTLGEDAAWPGLAEPVRVVLRERDGPVGFGQSSEIVRTRFLKVRKSEVESPAEDEVVELADDRRLKVVGTPMLDRKGVWTCEVVEVQP